MCWYGECSCLRQPKQPFILDRISWRTGRFTTNIDEILNLFNITQILILEHSEEILKVNTIDSASPSWKRSVLSHDQVIQWTKARVPVRSDSVLCLGKMNESKDAITRWEGQVEGFKNVSLENCWRSSWIRVEYFPRIYVIADSSEDPGWVARTEHRAWKNSQVGSSSCQCSTTSIGERKEMMEFVFRIQKKSRSTRRDAREDTGHFWVLETKRSGMELFLTHLKENEILQPVKWWNDSKIQVIQYSGVLVLLVVKFWKRRMAETPYTSIRMLEQFGRTEEEKGQEKQKESVTKDALTCVKSQEVKLLVSLQNNYLEPVCGKTIRTSNHWPRQFDSQGFANSHRSAQVSAGMNSKTRPDGDDGFGQIIPYCREYILSRAHPQSRIFAALPGGTIIGPDRGNHRPSWIWNCSSITQRQGTDILCNDFQRKESVRGWSPYSQCRTQIQCRLTHWTSESRRRRILLGTVED